MTINYRLSIGIRIRIVDKSKQWDGWLLGHPLIEDLEQFEAFAFIVDSKIFVKRRRHSWERKEVTREKKHCMFRFSSRQRKDFLRLRLENIMIQL